MKENKIENVKEFANYVAEHLFECTDEGHEIEVKEILKNNGVKLTGIIIKDKTCNVAPTLYVDRGFELYTDGTDIEEIMKSYLETYEKNKVHCDFSVDFFNDFEKVRDKLTIKVINAERNEELVNQCPHLIFGDLAAIFQIRLDTFEYGNATITVKKEHAKMWKIGTASLLTYAKLNMEEKEPVRIQSMREVLAAQIGIADEELLPGMVQMYVISNESKINGANSLIFTEKLQEFADEHECSFYIIPSSIHECILIPENDGINATDLEMMIREVNTNEVQPEEILSDRAYFYDRKKHELQMADTRNVMEIKVV